MPRSRYPSPTAGKDRSSPMNEQAMSSVSSSRDAATARTGSHRRPNTTRSSFGALQRPIRRYLKPVFGCLLCSRGAFLPRRRRVIYSTSSPSLM